MIIGSFDIETDILKKIEDGNVLLHIMHMNTAVNKSNYSAALIECQSAIDVCIKEEDKVYCLYTKALILFYANRNDECCDFIMENMKKFKKVFKYYSLVLCRIYNMLWQCNYRRKKYLQSLLDLCNITYLSGVLQIICFAVLFGAIVKKVSIDLFFINGQLAMAVLFAVVWFFITIVAMFYFNKCYLIPKKEI
ncbi:hypothetical protein [Inconstantimicrobium mannanitabidum]|uniref:Uncharacterized protein n=1 Tax=Inconstantimicrobium mannanitabidum TaxID=1604901 RepID=A0ACB5RDB8_9CLOT|nr:hypothetical protein [Clostridium sp. TW13]GKX66797.1 hypothetical protein rsdtw13_20550 [Clostridium sp. TW13]